MVVAAGPSLDRRLDQRVGVSCQLGPDEAALVVETDETALEPRRRVGIRGALDLGRQLPGLPRRPVLRRLGQVRVGLGRGHRGKRGEDIEGQAAVGQSAREGRELLHLPRGVDQRAGAGAADVAPSDQPVRHGERAVAAPGLRPVELGDVGQQGALVLRDHPLMSGDALRQLGRARIAAVVPAEGSGPAGGWWRRRDEPYGNLGRQVPYGRTVPREMRLERRGFGDLGGGHGGRRSPQSPRPGSGAAAAGLGWRGAGGASAMPVSSITTRKPT